MEYIDLAEETEAAAVRAEAERSGTVIGEDVQPLDFVPSADLSTVGVGFLGDLSRKGSPQ